VDECIISVISYEKWIDVFKGDPIEVKLRDFYNNCKEYNRIK